MNEPASTVNITFQSPARTNLSRASSRHSRDLKGVPTSTARKMARDFTTYKHEPSTIDGKRLYKYQPLGGRETSKSEVSVALDFGEIVALEVERKALPRKVS
ncbi:MAG: hypothetical protein BRD28_03105 [Bacteroidetes bacterium QH_10_64_37]|nr:MAG: hypothetical protein BRD28_03105 [Bacteroidetes bacterium QH_10_64_37]